MTLAHLHVRRAGPLVTVQDAGRRGWMRFGVPVSGPMDPFAHAAANVALGQAAQRAAIEISLGGMELECRAGSLSVAVCGGGFTVDHAGERCAPWSVRTVRLGDTISINPGSWGSWCYLAVAGELVAERWLDSSATHARSGLGGGLVRAGSDLVIRHARVDAAREGAIEPPATSLPLHDLRVVIGPQVHCFAREAFERLLQHPFTLTSAYDRMGVRLDGPELAIADVLSIPSTPIVRGSLQVAGDGVATLLLADHQTTGGYPKIATVIGDDVGRATQLRAGDTVRFSAIAPGTAIDAARAAAAERADQLAAISERPGLRARRLLDANLVDGVFHDDDSQRDDDAQRDDDSRQEGSE